MTGHATEPGVTAEVFPGGALASLHLTESALRDPDLAATILRVIQTATTAANLKVLHLLNGIDPELLGLQPEPEETTPHTWRHQ
ncbi:hypothetical protein V5P93_006100 [Actinokineospora auranticolor]|uniref:Uncharacterized protein n=1 Tax=Actinokineospora auranticolor TaxID=155976 RepID=A0A2S6GG26_9PSEU|nr:hypothetical protein [Actinokineospora auranticolor]PPK64189.1 hypothetical protein CLV40_12153 [Actinokineospora auranticolor]